jgi:hypothetical protein
MNPKTISQVLEEFEIEFPELLKDSLHYEDCICWSCNNYRKEVKSFIKSSLEEILMSMPFKEIDNFSNDEGIEGYNDALRKVKKWREQTLK